MTAVPDTLTTPVEELLARARAYVTHRHAKNTLDSYATDWKHFNSWCDDHKRRALPASPETILCYIVDLVDRHTIATIDRRLTSTGYYHKQAGHALPTKDPEVERTMRGIRRAKESRPMARAPFSRRCCARWWRRFPMIYRACAIKPFFCSGSPVHFGAVNWSVCRFATSKSVMLA
ncbi:MAG TPA: hypothetical protein VFU22_21410 [Roseiflexaceae bacterium]|nr:hypothetical protein [Roseiflexaceae bacterium]